MLDLTKPVQTLDGRKARILCTDLEGDDGYTIVAAVHHSKHVEDVHRYTRGGVWSKGKASGLDLVNVHEKVRVKGWLNINEDGGMHFLPETDRGTANLYARKNRIACVEIDMEVEKGHGL